MDTGARLALFATGLVLAFGAAFGLGRAIGAVGEADPAVRQVAPTTVHEGGHP
jgi:hypothetical protein